MDGEIGVIGRERLKRKCDGVIGVVGMSDLGADGSQIERRGEGESWRRNN